MLSYSMNIAHKHITCIKDLLKKIGHLPSFYYHDPVILVVFPFIFKFGNPSEVKKSDKKPNLHQKANP